MIRSWSRTVEEYLSPSFGRLTIYNQEKARGIEHSRHLDREMAILQEEFDMWLKSLPQQLPPRLAN